MIPVPSRYPGGIAGRTGLPPAGTIARTLDLQQAWLAAALRGTIAIPLPRGVSGAWAADETTSARLAVRLPAFTRWVRWRAFGYGPSGSLVRLCFAGETYYHAAPLESDATGWSEPIALAYATGGELSATADGAQEACRIALSRGPVELELRLWLSDPDAVVLLVELQPCTLRGSTGESLEDAED